MNFCFVDVCAINLGWVIDQSGSIVVDQNPPAWGNWEAIQDFTVNVLEQVDISDTKSFVGLVTFSTKYAVYCYLLTKKV